jgi:TonB family protein
LDPRRRKQHWQALAISVFGFGLVVLLLNLMNGTMPMGKKKTPETVQFQPKKLKQRRQQKIPKKKVAKKPENRVNSLKPKMNLAFANSGLDLGIDILGLATGDSQLLSRQGGTVMTEDVVDRLPQVQYREAIPYPRAAKEKNVEGHVTVNILVNKEGEVEQVKLLDSRPEGVFDQVTLAAVQSWSFRPAEYKGQFVSVWVKQKLKFQVN